LARRLFWTWCKWLSSTGVFVGFSILYLDRPISRFTYDELGGISWLAQMPAFYLMLISCILVVFSARRLVGYILAKPDLAIILVTLSVVVTELVKRMLKFLCGRTWPAYAYPSYIESGEYSFNPFKTGVIYGSFPSGHAMPASAICAVLWCLYPKHKLL
jgi:hypothetical protein